MHITNNGYSGNSVCSRKKYKYESNAIYFSAQVNIPHHYDLVGVTHTDEVYHTEQIHFHWGDATDNVTGSEHQLDGQAFPLEVKIF